MIRGRNRCRMVSASSASAAPAHVVALRGEQHRTSFRFAGVVVDDHDRPHPRGFLLVRRLRQPVRPRAKLRSSEQRAVTALDLPATWVRISRRCASRP